MALLMSPALQPDREAVGLPCCLVSILLEPMPLFVSLIPRFLFYDVDEEPSEVDALRHPHLPSE